MSGEDSLGDRLRRYEKELVGEEEDDTEEE